MKQETISKIIENHCFGQPTYIGQYTYNLARDPETNKCYIIRCKRIDEKREWIDWQGNFTNAWKRICEIEIDF